MAVLSRRSQFVLWIAAATFALAALAGVMRWEQRPSAARHAVYVVGDAEQGAALFFGEKHCSNCHSVNGRGGHSAPDLAGISPRRPAMGWLTTVLWNHAPEMWRQMQGSSTPHLDRSEMAHILAFLYQVGSADRPGNAAVGELVFSEKGCVRCHATQKEHNRRGPELARVAAAGDAVAWMHAMWDHAQYMVGPITKEMGAWPEFQGDEMNNLIAYLTVGKPAVNKGIARGNAERGWHVFEAKCIRCHAVGGTGGNVGPGLGPDHDLPYTATQFAAVLWNHAPAMVRHAREAGIPTPTLEGNDIADVLSFLASLRYYEPAGSPFLGERVFNERGCARCHGAKAEGTRVAPPLRAGADAFTTVTLATAMWSHGPAMQEQSQRLGIPWPSLEPGDVGNLISFLNTAGK